MNKEEAIKYGIEWLEDEYLDTEDRAFIELALEALKQEPCKESEEVPCDNCKYLDGDGCRLVFEQAEYGEVSDECPNDNNELSSVNPQPCEDAISRQAVLDMATTIQTDDFSGNEIIEVVDIDDVKALPPVTPQPKTGHWVLDNDKEHGRCSECGCKEDLVDGHSSYKWCSNCGAKMIEPQESEK